MTDTLRDRLADNGPCCAHKRVNHIPVEVGDGLYRDSWRCATCGAEFVRELDARPQVTGETSDGYHTFNELYAHRTKLFIALAKFTGAWRSMKHADGTMFDGWFIMGIGKEPSIQITYHLPIAEWPNTSFCETLANAPEWDGHTPNDVLTRLGSVEARGGDALALSEARRFIRAFDNLEDDDGSTGKSIGAWNAMRKAVAAFKKADGPLKREAPRTEGAQEVGTPTRCERCGHLAKPTPTNEAVRELVEAAKAYLDGSDVPNGQDAIGSEVDAFMVIENRLHAAIAALDRAPAVGDRKEKA